MKRGYNFLEITKNQSLREEAGMLFPGVVFPKPSFPCTLNVNHSRRSPTIWNHENSHCLCSPSIGNADALTGLKKTACLHRVVHFLVLDCSTNNRHPRGAVIPPTSEQVPTCHRRWARASHSRHHRHRRKRVWLWEIKALPSEFNVYFLFKMLLGLRHEWRDWKGHEAEGSEAEECSIPCSEHASFQVGDVWGEKRWFLITSQIW